MPAFVVDPTNGRGQVLSDKHREDFTATLVSVWRPPVLGGGLNRTDRYTRSVMPVQDVYFQKLSNSSEISKVSDIDICA